MIRKYCDAQLQPQREVNSLEIYDCGIFVHWKLLRRSLKQKAELHIRQFLKPKRKN